MDVQRHSPRPAGSQPLDEFREQRPAVAAAGIAVHLPQGGPERGRPPVERKGVEVVAPATARRLVDVVEQMVHLARVRELRVRVQHQAEHGRPGAQAAIDEDGVGHRTRTSDRKTGPGQCRRRSPLHHAGHVVKNSRSAGGSPRRRQGRPCSPRASRAARPGDRQEPCC